MVPERVLRGEGLCDEVPGERERFRFLLGPEVGGCGAWLLEAEDEDERFSS